MAGEHSVAVVVLGDVGRSPRMQYHAVSLSRMPGTSVSLVGYTGEACVPDVEQNDRITKHLIGNPFQSWNRAWFLLWAPLKVLYQLYQLLWTLLSIPAPSAYLVQNPPSIPALAAVWLAARLRSARLVIDWHNFGYTVLATSMGVGQSHPVVVLAYWYEYFFGRCGDGHFCVTAAMADWLRHTWGIHATVLYDRAPEAFKPPSAAAVHALLRDMRPPLPKVCKEVGPDATPLTHLDEGGR